jgi:hypothetical protein
MVDSLQTAARLQCLQQAIKLMPATHHSALRELRRHTQ